MAGVEFGSLTGIGNGVDSAFARAIDADQVANSVVTGRFSGTVDFAPDVIQANNSDILTARGSCDIYVAKYSADGSLLWAVQFGGDDGSYPNGEGGVAIELDGSGNIYVGGEFKGASYFGTQTLVSAGSSDAFVAKLNSSGAVQWARRWGNLDFDTFLGLDVDSTGNVHAVSNRFEDSMTIKKFSANGVESWSKEIATRAHSSTDGGIAVDASGSVYVTGNFYGTVDFDPSSKAKNVSVGPSSTGLGTAFVLSLNAQGNLRWVSPFSAQPNPNGFYGRASAQSLAIDKTGNVLVGGFRNGLIDFQASSAISILPGEAGGFLASLNPSSGYLNWAKSFDTAGAGTVAVWDLDIDATGSIYAAGAFSGVADFDPSSGVIAKSPVPSNVANSSDAFYMKLSASGNLLWVEAIGGAGSDAALGIAADGAGGVHVAGNIYPGGPIDFNPDSVASNELTTSAARKGFRLRVTQA